MTFGSRFIKTWVTPRAQLDPAERMLNHLPSLAHRPRVQIQPTLHRLQHVLMLPARDPALRSYSAAALEQAAEASHGPVAPHDRVAQVDSEPHSACSMAFV